VLGFSGGAMALPRWLLDGSSGDGMSPVACFSVSSVVGWSMTQQFCAIALRAVFTPRIGPLLWSVKPPFDGLRVTSSGDSCPGDGKGTLRRAQGDFFW
jgi:hypothetical protein